MLTDFLSFCVLSLNQWLKLGAPSGDLGVVDGGLGLNQVVILKNQYDCEGSVLERDMDIVDSHSLNSNKSPQSEWGFLYSCNLDNSPESGEVAG